MQSKLLQEVANTLLKDTQDFFQLGSTNNPSVMQSNEQFTFINKIRVDFLKKYEEVEKGAQFFLNFPHYQKRKKFLFEKKET